MDRPVKNATIAFADDDAGMRTVLEKIIARAPGYELVGQAEDGEAMLRLFQKTRPDVVILDVEMPEMDGIECARAIQDENPLAILIFATAHDQYMREAFELYAFDYLLKPFKLERALQTLERARTRLIAPPPEPDAPRLTTPLSETPSRLMLKHREGINLVDMSEVLLIQREDRMTVVYAEGGKRYVTGETMGDLEARLPKDVFLRCHKSYIVNINHIDSISPYGRWTHIAKIRGTKQDALITHERFEALEKMFG